METHCLGSIMFLVVLGHLTGDFLLQSKYVAINKAGNKKICAYHCTIYTFCICLFTWNFSPLFAILIFLSHYSFDYYSFGGWWLKLIKGRNFMEEFEMEDKYRDIALPFATIVYVVTDATFHFLFIFGGIMFLNHSNLF